MRRRAVMVEDDASRRDIIAHTLTGAGVEAGAFTEPESSLYDGVSHGAALIVANLTLGTRDAYILRERAREPIDCDTPIVVSCGWPPLRVVERSRVRDVCAKPFDLAQFEAMGAWRETGHVNRGLPEQWARCHARQLERWSRATRHTQERRAV